MQTAHRLLMNLLVIESNREVSEMLDALFYALVTELNALQRCVRLIFVYGHCRLLLLPTGTGQKRFFVLKRHHFHETRASIAPMLKQFCGQFGARKPRVALNELL